MELYVCPGGEHGEGDRPGRVFLCRPGIDDNVAEVFDTGMGKESIGADEAANRIACSVNAITRIVALLDGEPEWDSETMGDLANILHEFGFKLRDAREAEGT